MLGIVRPSQTPPRDAATRRRPTSVPRTSGHFSFLGAFASRRPTALAAVVGVLCWGPLSGGLWDRAAVAADVAAATDWPMDRGDAGSTGSVPQTLPSKLTELWRYEVGEPVEATAVVADGRVFIGDVDGGLHAVSLADGSRLWKQDTEAGFLAAPAASKSLVVIGDLDGVVHAFDAATGEGKWTYPTDGQIDAGASLIEDAVLVTSQDGSLYSIDPADGTLRWRYETGDQIRCRPSIAGDRTFLGGCDGSLHSVVLLDGREAADPLPLDGPTGSTPALVGDYAFVPSQSGAVLAFDWKAGKLLWSYSDEGRPQEFRNSAAVTSERVVVASQNRRVVALDPKTGDVVWTRSLRRRADGSPVIAGEDVWVAATDGRLYRFALADGEEKWQFEIRGAFVAPPAIAGDRLIVATDGGTVICFGPESH